MNEYELHPQGFELMNKWYEKVIPADEIPDEFQREMTLPGGGKQIVDSRIPAYRYWDNKGAWVPCSDAFFDDEWLK